MCLKGYLGTFRKSHKVSAVKFDPFGVKLRVESDLGLYGPPVSNRVNKTETWSVSYGEVYCSVQNLTKIGVVHLTLRKVDS